MHNIPIDHEAKLPIFLDKLDDASGRPFYVGRLQLDMKLSFRHGLSFFVFISDEGSEMLQIGMINHKKRNRSKKSYAELRDGRTAIGLRPFTDRDDNIAYVGEAHGFVELDFLHGIFFTIFLSQEGREELQITPLDHKQVRNRKERFYQEEDEDESDQEEDDEEPQAATG